MDGSNFSIGRAIDKQVVTFITAQIHITGLVLTLKPNGYQPQFCSCFLLICNHCIQPGCGTLQSSFAEEIQELSNMLSGQLFSSSGHITQSNAFFEDQLQFQSRLYEQTPLSIWHIVAFLNPCKYKICFDFNLC